MEVTVPTKVRILRSIAIVGWLLLCCGCSAFPRRFPERTIPAPVALPQNPSLDDIVQVVNDNSSRVQQLQINNATLTAPRLPSLKTFIVLDRPRRFRMTAESFAGQEFDLGSNDDRYWIWIRRDERRAVYHGLHDSFYESPARKILPVPPTWLIEALGMVQFDSTAQHDGPMRVSPGRLQVRSRIPIPTGELIRITDVDESHGWVMQQEVYDARTNELLASATASEFNYYPEQGVSLPRSIQIQLPPASLQFALRIDNHSINQNYIDPNQMWSMPQPNGAELIDVNRLSSPPPDYVGQQPYRGGSQNGIYRHAQRQEIRRLPLLRGRY